MIFKVQKLTKATQDGSLNDVVKSAQIAYCAVDGDIEVCANCEVTFDAPDAASFIPFGEVTEQMVIDWAKSKIKFEEFDAGLRAVVEERKKLVTIDNPFGA